LISAGDIDAEGQKDSVVLKDTDNSIYKKLVIQNNTIVRTSLCGDVKDRLKIIKAIESGKDISAIRKELELWNMETSDIHGHLRKNR
jgi:nitrite reductase (NADH) large subunit